MDSLTSVSETALITLKARVEESKKAEPVIRDEIGVEFLERLQRSFPNETGARILDRKLPRTLSRHIALRARKYDAYARDFVGETPGGLVVSAGAGFDTRYWRVSQGPWNYVEVDLPEVIEAKKALLGDIASYEMIGCSVLDDTWIENVRSMQSENILFLAEGLFMYLPKSGVIQVFNKLSEAFSKSQIVFEVVRERYTKGIWKKIVESKMRRSAGTEAGSSFQFGVRNAGEVESYGKSIKVVDEWSYFEDKDIVPGFLRLLRNVSFISKTQWTVLATIG
jgi:methyltransferase (TIGR00027 family)